MGITLGLKTYTNDLTNFQQKVFEGCSTKLFFTTLAMLIPLIYDFWYENSKIEKLKEEINLNKKIWKERINNPGEGFRKKAFRREYYINNLIMEENSAINPAGFFKEYFLGFLLLILIQLFSNYSCNPTTDYFIEKFLFENNFTKIKQNNSSIMFFCFNIYNLLNFCLNLVINYFNMGNKIKILMLIQNIFFLNVLIFSFSLTCNLEMIFPILIIIIINSLIIVTKMKLHKELNKQNEEYQNLIIFQDDEAMIENYIQG